MEKSFLKVVVKKAWYELVMMILATAEVILSITNKHNTGFYFAGLMFLQCILLNVFRIRLLIEEQIEKEW